MERSSAGRVGAVAESTVSSKEASTTSTSSSGKESVLGGISAGDADVFVSSQFALNWLQGESQIRALTPLIEQDETFDRLDFYPGTLELYTREGEVWAIPAGVDLMVMYSQRDLFEANGVPEPEIGWTWDDFYATTLQLRDPVADVYGYAPSLDLFDPLTFIYQHGGRIFDDLENPTGTTFDDPLTVEALLQRDGIYKRLWDYQSGGFLAAD